MACPARRACWHGRRRRARRRRPAAEEWHVVPRGPEVRRAICHVVPAAASRHRPPRSRGPEVQRAICRVVPAPPPARAIRLGSGDPRVAWLRRDGGLRHAGARDRDLRPRGPEVRRHVATWLSSPPRATRSLAGPSLPRGDVGHCATAAETATASRATAQPAAAADEGLHQSCRSLVFGPRSEARCARHLATAPW